MRSLRPVSAMPFWRNSRAAASTIRSRVAAASSRDLRILDTPDSAKFLNIIDAYQHPKDARASPMRPAGSLTSEARNTIVRRLLEQDARAYRAVLLEALIVRPECFPRHYHEEMSRSLEDIERQLAAEIILGAWIKDELVGIVAFAAKSLPKQRHAGTISHLYVKERFRRKGVAGLLIGAVL